MSGLGSLDGQALIERALARASKAGAQQVDGVLIVSDSQEAKVRGAEIETVKQSQERCLGLRAMVGGSEGLATAITSTSDLSPEAIDRMADETVALARATAPDPHAGLPDGPFATRVPDLNLADPADREVPLESRIEEAKRAEAAARAVDPRIDNSEGSQVGSDWNRIFYGNSLGFSGEYESAYHSIFSEPLARSGESMQRDYWMSVARRLGDLADAAEVGRRAAEGALRRLGARRAKTGEVAVIFDERTAPSLLGQLAACINGYSVYRESSFLANQLGAPIATPALTLIDDGRKLGGLASRPFDGEGLATQRNVVVEQGVLKTWLMDAYSARKLEMSSTGSASRGAGSSPSVGTTNLWIQPGEGTLDEIVADTEKGLLVTELIGMGFNPTTGDYSRGASGLWIEQGEILYPVEEITIAGNLGEMLQNIDRVGSELVWHGRTACPPLRVAQMTLAGE